MNIVITGGTGFLGHEVIEVLKREGGHTIYGLARSERSAQSLRDQGVIPVDADLTNADRLRGTLKDLRIDAVFHLAAEIASQRSRAKLRAVNVDGTRHLLDAILPHKELKSFIFASTVVTGEAKGALLTEDRPLIVETEYGRTKQTAEKMLLDAHAKSGFPAIIVRPCHIYGNGGWFGGIIHQIRKNSLRMPGNGQNLWDVIFVEDCAAAFIAAMKHGKPGEIYHCADDTPVAMGVFVAEAARLAGGKTPGRAPRFLANLAFGKDTITSVIRSARTSNAKLKTLGWKPAYPDYKTGLARTFAQ